MRRYIDADIFTDILYAKADMALGTPKEVFLSVAKMLEKIPTADVAEVEHGIWISNPVICHSLYCSCCGAIGNGGDYCSHCGAKMDGEKK